MLRMSCDAVVVVDARVHRVDDAAGAEEEAGLEEGVREDVEEAGRERADADAEEHEAELAHGGVGEHLLDVVLDEAMVAAKSAVSAPMNATIDHRRRARARTRRDRRQTR